MTKFKSSGVKESIANAIHGLMLAVSSQRNFVIELIISAVVLIAALLFRFSVTDFCILILMIAIVLVCELINSVIEFTLDAVYKNNYSRLVEMAKDISAGMVLMVAIISILLGSILFGSYAIKNGHEVIEKYKYQKTIKTLTEMPLTIPSDSETVLPEEVNAENHYWEKENVTEKFPLEEN